MRITPRVRRSVAVTATTALVTGGFASGFLAAPAFAGPTDPTISSVSPAAAINASASDLTINGQNFVAAADTVSLIPLFTGDAVNTIAATVDKTNSTTSALLVSADLTQAAPGPYRVQVAQTASATATCDSCFTVTSSGAATATSAAAGTGNGNKTTTYSAPLTFTGTNIANGATVTFLKPDGSVDPALAFKEGWSDGTSGYMNASTLRGSYTSTFSGNAPTPGRHLIKLDNTAQPFATPTLDFFQPVFDSTGVTPNNLGEGATNQTVTVTGKGFRSGSKIEISGGGNSNCASDVTVGSTSFSQDNNTGNTILSAPVSLLECAPATARTIGVRGPDGGYCAVAGAFTVNPQPTVTKFAPNALGQGGTRPVVVTGTGFSSANPPVFTFDDPRVTAVTTSVPDAQTADVTITATGDAPVGAIGVTATNPADHGSAHYATSSTTLFTINAGPQITSNPTPSSTALGSTSPTITVKGNNFDTSNSMVVKLYTEDADGNLVDDSAHTHVVGVTVAAPSPLDPSGPDTLTFQVQVDSNATPGLRDVYLQNNGDKGATLCRQCFGVDSLALSPNAGSNTGVYTLHVIGQGIKADGTSSVELVRVNAPASEPHIVGSWVASTLTDGDATQADATFNLTDAAPGPYNAIVQVDPTHTLSCSHCFTVAGQAITVTGISPDNAGQGAKNVPVTITGTHFSRGEIVSIANVNVHDTTFIDSTHLSILVDVDANAATGAQTVTVTNADGAHSATSTFTVNAGPKPTAVTAPASGAYGQGAGTDGTTQTITVTGPGFVTGASAATSSTLSLGTDITVTNVVVTQGASSPLNSNPDDTLTANVVIPADASKGFHNIVVTNPDQGVGTLAGKFTVNAGPKVTSVSPPSLRPGAAGQALVVTGTGFTSASVLTINGLTLTNPVVNGDGTQISVTASVNTDSTGGPGLHNITVSNPGDKGYLNCVGCFTIANPPSAPQSMTFTPGAGSLTAKWFAPSDNGGSTPTGYQVTLFKSGATVSNVVVEANTLQKAFTGLINGATYVVHVAAINVAGPGIAAVASGVPGIASTLTSGVTPATVTYGGPVTYSGKLMSGSTPLGGKTITLAFTPSVGAAFTRTATTTSTGAWSYRSAPPYTVTMRASALAGDPTYRPASAVANVVRVAARVLKTSPASGAKSSATTTLKITGSVGPNKAGKVVYLYRYTSRGTFLVAKTTLTSSSTFTFTGKPAKGTYTFRVYIPATTGNVAGYSAAFVIYRT